MKKQLFFALLLPVMGFGQWTENFDASTALPAGWAIINNGDPNGWTGTTNATFSQSGTNLFGIARGTTAHDDYLITKAISVTSGVSDRVSFYIRSALGTALENYEILLSTTDQTKPAFTTVLQSTEKAPVTWTQKTFNLSAYNGQTVYVAIHATDTNQLALLADTFVVDAAPVLTTSEAIKIKDDAKIYPNPFTDYVHISDIDHVSSVLVSDVSGKTVKNISNPQKEINLSGLQPGSYFITVRYKNQSVKTFKSVKK
ncbi:T9SS-dependent choice-of-anchor J family protein [Chryseobacterium sp. Tr-659]|uniref:T9SS-dependent choice-of-anchor J family protein n=1 Tax=Chryseobacterium sp. Tr-659 TaxID=2608340 RepID=UPI001421337F|nr:choice-of-anchor J domain-containing protein [Chryseobacterium sp. Tr-659]